MIRLFLNGNSSVLAIIPLLVIGYDFLWMHSGFSESIDTNSIFSNQSLSKLNSMLCANSIILINAVLLNYVFNFNSFHSRNIYLPSLLYVISCSFFSFFYVFSIDTIVHFFIIIIFNQFLQIPIKDSKRALVFNIFFFQGIILVLQPEHVIILPLLIMVLFRYAILNFKDGLVILISVFLPIIYYFLISFVFDIKHLLLKDFSFDLAISHNLKVLVIASAVFIYAFLSFRQLLASAGLILKKNLEITMFFVLLLLFQSFFCSNITSTHDKGSYLYIPLSILLTYGFIHKSFSMLTTSSFYLVLLFSLLKFFIV